MKQTLKTSATALILLSLMSISLFSHANANREKIFKKIPSSSSLKYLYSDIAFTGPEKITASNCEALTLEFIKSIKNHNKECMSISYKTTEYKTYAVLIKSTIKLSSSPPNLLVYNHGHSGLPSKSEIFAYELVTEALATGNDVLLVNMPFTGMDKQHYPIMVKSWDGEVRYNPKDLEDNFSAQHGIFEMFDTGKSHYMRFFMDSAVVTILSIKEQYKEVNFLGLSGGATTGLYTCNVLKDILSNCILVAGVMPIKYKFNKSNFGDAEQFSSNFFRKNKIINIVKEISNSKTNLHLIYNDKDPCCFAEDTASLFRDDLKANHINNINYSIRSSDAHDYSPKYIIDTINSR